MGVPWSSYPDARSAAEACGRHILARLEDYLAGRDCATLCVSGGNTPRPLFETLAASNFQWGKVHLFWVDERGVPPTDPQSNYGLAAETFLNPARFPQQNVHRVHAELSPVAAARRYVEEIREFFGLEEGELPRFDIVHRGIGSDGHTASLFPGDPLLDDHGGIAAAVHVEKLGQWRITLLPDVLMATRYTVILAAGADKAGIVRAVLQGPYDPRRYPAQIAAHHGRNVAWFLDEAAARLLEA